MLIYARFEKRLGDFIMKSVLAQAHAQVSSYTTDEFVHVDFLCTTNHIYFQ